MPRRSFYSASLHGMWLERVASFTGGSFVVLSLRKLREEEELEETVLGSDRFS